VKEVQLSPRIDPHDLGVKVSHAVGFLCEDMKVKVVLKFRGREMAHTEFGFQVVEKFIAEVAPYGHPDFQPKLVGRSITLMISPLPRNKRAKPPQGEENRGPNPAEFQATGSSQAVAQVTPPPSKPVHKVASKPAPSAFANNPFAKIDLSVREDAKSES